MGCLSLARWIGSSRFESLEIQIERIKRSRDYRLERFVVGWLVLWVMMESLVDLVDVKVLASDSDHVNKLKLD